MSDFAGTGCLRGRARPAPAGLWWLFSLWGAAAAASSAARRYVGGSHGVIGAILVSAPLDHDVSAVDVQTDAHIRDSLRDSYRDATKIIVAHRINTLKDADQILVMDDGRIVDRGTHEELIARPGLYQDVYKMQSEWEATA